MSEKNVTFTLNILDDVFRNIFLGLGLRYFLRFPDNLLIANLPLLVTSVILSSLYKYPDARALFFY